MTDDTVGMFHEPITYAETIYAAYIQAASGSVQRYLYPGLPDRRWVVEECRRHLRADAEYARVMTETKRYTTATLPSGATAQFLLSTTVWFEDIELTADELRQRDDRRRVRQRRERRHWAVVALGERPYRRRL